MWHETLFDEFKASAYQCKKERSATFKIRQNAYPAGAQPGTPLGELTTLPEHCPNILL